MGMTGNKDMGLSKENKQEILRRLVKIRTRIIREHGFYGNLLMHVGMGIAECETAYTDGRNIVFDPVFLESLPDEEVVFVMLHEVLHMVLCHCTRGIGKNKYLFNIACDIVVNSHILAELEKDMFFVAGRSVMHQIPDSCKEGRQYTAEQVYEMLLDGGIGIYAILAGNEGFDRHDTWLSGKLVPVMETEWNLYRKEAAGKYGYPKRGGGELQKELEWFYDHRKQEVDWKKELQNFVQMSYNYNAFDYSFCPADRRYSYADFAVPSFHEVESSALKNIWFVVDTSGSVLCEHGLLDRLFSEIRNAVIQYDYLSATLSCFDSSVSEPQEFCSVESLQRIKPTGGGETSFQKIFDYMAENMKDALPVAVIVMTDGECPFPDEAVALGVPVLWVIAGRKSGKVAVPWGRVIKM